MDIRVKNIENQLITGTKPTDRGIGSLSSPSIGVTPVTITPIIPTIKPKKENPTPETTPTMPQKVIKLYTIDNTVANEQNYISESYTITPGNFTPVRLGNSGGLRYFYQFGKSNYGIKFHMPYGSNKDKVYLTYCVKDTEYQDNVKDYTDTIPQEWVDAAISFCKEVPANIQGTSPYAIPRDFSPDKFPKSKKRTLYAFVKGRGGSSNATELGTIKFSFTYQE